MSVYVTPPKDWLHFGCTECGNVVTVPSGGPDDAPYCLHHGNSYSWRPDVSGKWTKMFPVAVQIAKPAGR